MRGLLLCCFLFLGGAALAETAEDVAKQNAAGTRPEGEEIFDQLKEPMERNRKHTVEGMKSDASTRFYFYTFMMFAGVICAALLGYKANSVGRPVGMWVMIGFFFGPLSLLVWFLWGYSEQMKLERDLAEAEADSAQPQAKPKTPEEIDAQIAAKLDPAFPATTPDALRAQFRALIQSRLGDPSAKSIGANDGGLLFLLNLFSGKYGTVALATLARQSVDPARFAQGFQAFIQTQAAAGVQPDERVYFSQACVPVLEQYKDWGVLQKYLYECQSHPDTGALDVFYAMNAKRK